jgi:hypothetical protein
MGIFCQLVRDVLYKFFQYYPSVNATVENTPALRAEHRIVYHGLGVMDIVEPVVLTTHPPRKGIGQKITL